MEVFVVYRMPADKSCPVHGVYSNLEAAQLSQADLDAYQDYDIAELDLDDKHGIAHADDPFRPGDLVLWKYNMGTPADRVIAGGSPMRVIKSGVMPHGFGFEGCLCELVTLERRWFAADALVKVQDGE